MKSSNVIAARSAKAPRGTGFQWEFALTAVARSLVLSLDREQVVTKKAVRLHCHSLPRSGSDTMCGRPTATAAPATTIATAAIASVLDLCQNLMAASVVRGLESAPCRHESL